MINTELERLYAADQEDRTSGMSDAELAERDRERLVWVKENLHTIDFSEIWNCHYAALLLQHSDSEEDVRLAHEYADKAVRMGSSVTRWLYAATYDRLQVMQGNRQKYGTQFIETDSGRKYFPVVGIIGDEELSTFGVESMAGKDFTAQIPRTSRDDSTGSSN
ncbi:MAG: hypothetical protein TR69_WS6001001242 [candidate division WS6 bacterium OLB20]|uniref:Uncharacterized protein n=1 Tax=candidate division WS6 bacterium OLB20 TaxID=1617426 RepID=A0A136LXB7_9BACT|nr:MAG: hypothetical protein TR69_WS6001001242 [candidate division WS6 bacterium OLB20]